MAEAPGGGEGPGGALEEWESPLGWKMRGRGESRSQAGEGACRLPWLPLEAPSPVVRSVFLCPGATSQAVTALDCHIRPAG